jgi:hypothetical protein
MKSKLPFALFFSLTSFLAASGQGSGISGNAPAVSFYVGIGEGSFGEDPHPVHGVECPSGGFIVGGKSIDSGGHGMDLHLRFIHRGYPVINT